MSISKKALIAAACVPVLLLASNVTAHEYDTGKREVVVTHDLSGFDRIAVEGIYNLDIEVGPTFSVRTEARKKEADDVEVYVKGDTLVLGQKDDRKHRNNTKGVNAIVTLPSLESVEIAGIANGDIRGIDGGDFEADIAGISNVHFYGRCDSLDIDVAGMGDTDASKLICDDVRADLGGMGKLSVHATQSVDADMGGMGSIQIYGDPENRRTSSSPMSSVSFVD